jgi:Domain of unknown function (DUF4116)
MTQVVTQASSTLIALTAGENIMERTASGEVVDADRCGSTSGVAPSKSAADINEERCQQILECKRQILFWKSKLEVLEKERERCLKLQRVKLDPAGTWRALSKSERHDKEFIKSALLSSSDCQLPTELENFPNTGSSSIPTHLRLDKELFLARIARDDIDERLNNNNDRGRLFIPPKLRSDKTVVLTVLPKHPAAVLESMGCELRDDDEVFEAVLDLLDNSESSSWFMGELPTNFLQHFSTRIRSSRSLMMRLCRHHAGLSSMTFVSHELRNDKKFFTGVLQQWCGTASSSRSTHYREKKGILSYASTRLRDDKDVVMSAVQVSGLNLKHASSSLRRDQDVIMEAMRENSTAFRFVLPGDIKTDLLNDRSFALNHVLKTSPISRSVFRSCIDCYSDDREVVLRAISCHSSGSLDWGCIPRVFQHDRQFVKDALDRNPKVFLNLPLQLRTESDIALYACQIDEVDGDVILEATEQCPSLLSNRDAMLSIAKAWWTDVSHETLQFSPIEIRNDKEIMIEAVSNDFSALAFCPDELQNDREVVLAAIESSPRDASDCLLYITASFQRANPDIMLRIIKSCPSESLWRMQGDIDEDLWSDRNIALAWLSNGGDWLSEEFPEEFENDKELVLAVVRSNWDDFEYASIKLRNDKDFMLRAVEIDGRVIRDVGDDLRHDEDLALRAFSKDVHAIQFYSDGDDFEFMVSLTSDVRRRLDEYDNFQSLIFANTAHPSKNPGNPLSVLNQGPDSVRHFTQLLGSYVGLPSPSDLRRLRQASINLLSWGF